MACLTFAKNKKEAPELGSVKQKNAGETAPLLGFLKTLWQLPPCAL